MTAVEIDRTRFARAADLIRTNGFWQSGKGEKTNGRLCAGLALLQAKHEVALPVGTGPVDPFYAEVSHLARQLGYNNAGNGFLTFIFGWNNSTEEAEVLDVLDKLARGESLV